MGYRYPPLTGDPSGVAQDFSKIRINIQCCRYWWLSRWKHKRLSYPFWRLYYNFNEGASVFYRQRIGLGPGRIFLIPPFTPFSTDLEGAGEEYGLEGGWIKSQEIEERSMVAGHVLHLFIHFNLGYPMDSVAPGVYELEAGDEEMTTIGQIAGKLKGGSLSFSLEETLLLYKLITSLLTRLPQGMWRSEQPEARVQRVIQYMNRNFEKRLTNEELAGLTGMAVNSFARLFREQTGSSPMRHLTKIRIENACNMLYHSDTNVSRIAEESGYSDRYYFSKMFRKEMGISPVRYRKQFVLG
jgi:AraC-like DNA-binding protein